jgi:hypothetical protein
MTPDPTPGPVVAPNTTFDPKTLSSWKAVLAALQKAGPERYQHFTERRQQQQRAHNSPTAKMKKTTFCTGKVDRSADTEVAPEEG